MGVKVDLANIQSGFQSATTLQSNYDEIEQGFDRALDRTQSTDNAMQVDIDMGNNDIVNTKDLFLYGGLFLNDEDLVGQIIAARDNAQASATAAADSEDAAALSATTAQNARDAAQASETQAQQSATAAAFSESAAESSATAAASSASEAAVSETNAETSEINALSYKGEAEDARDLALQYRDTSLSHRDSAQQARDDAEQALFTFNARYYGPLADDPTEDLNGNPPTTGDWYFNTASNEVRVYDGTSWSVVITPSDFQSSSTSEALEGTSVDTWMSPARTHEAFTQFGIGSSDLITDATFPEADLNNGCTVKTGFYFVPDTVSNRPSGVGAGIVTNLVQDGTGCYQLFATLGTSTRQYTRWQESASWTPWRRNVNSGDVATTAQAEAGTNNENYMTPLKTAQHVDPKIDSVQTDVDALQTDLQNYSVQVDEALDNVFSAKRTIQVFETDGTWTRPEGCVYVRVQAQGPGGDGQGTEEQGTGEGAAGSGGGGGGYAESVINVENITSASVNVETNEAKWDDGVNIVRGNQGPSGGQFPASPESDNRAFGPGPPGGSGTGDFVAVGGRSGKNIISLSNGWAMGGYGGDSVLGQGASYSFVHGPGSGSQSVGYDALGYGGGGSGACGIEGFARDGGAGGPAVVIVHEFYKAGPV